MKQYEQSHATHGTGQVLESAHGERMVIREATPDLLRFEWYRPVGLPSFTPADAHPTQEQRIRVLEGRLRVKMAGKSREYGPGEEVVIPADTFHTVANATDEAFRGEVRFSPAEAILPFLEDVVQLKVSPVSLAKFSKRHRRAVRLAAPYQQILGFLGRFV